MKKIKLLSAVIGLLLGANIIAGDVINGAGASFPYPVYSQWAYQYNKTTGVKLNYQSIGSGGGIAQIKAKTVDFGASDNPLKKEELDAAGLIQFPMVMGGVVPVINVKGVPAGSLKLSGALLADIFMGKVAKWDDSRIKAENPGANLPNQNIVVVHRADGSGTTWIFTNYLAKVSPEWKTNVGNDKAVKWPVGIGGKGNEGVAAYVSRTNGAIGYVEFAYALTNKMNYTQLKNKDGRYVLPTISSFQAAAASANWAAAPGFYMVLTDQSGVESWPITGASYILIYKNQVNLDTASTMLKFFDWCYKNGEVTAKNLYYVPMPKNVVEMVKSSWNKEVSSAGKPVI